MQTFTTRDEAIDQAIITAIEAGDATAEDYDIDAIADQVLGGYEDGYAQIVDEDEFWDTVADNAL